jgi:hypothetical protein
MQERALEREIRDARERVHQQRSLVLQQVQAGQDTKLSIETLIAMLKDLALALEHKADARNPTRTVVAIRVQSPTRT